MLKIRIVLSVLIVSVLVIYISINGWVQKPKILFVNSYHKGYPSSDEITSAISEGFPLDDYDLKINYLNTKREQDTLTISRKTKALFKLFENFAPNVVIASDDNAVKYFVARYLKNKNVPVIFCGVNWDAGQYGLPVENITGILEVLPLPELLSGIRQQYPGNKKLCVLSENTTSEQNNKKLLDTLFVNQGYSPTYSLVDNFEQWKIAFLEATQSQSIIYLPTNGAIKNWNDEEAEQFVSENIKYPVVTCDDFMMKYCVFGMTKIAREQGEWAVQQAKEILIGTSPSDIPVAKNKQVNVWLNKKLVDKINFELEMGDVDVRDYK